MWKKILYILQKYWIVLSIFVVVLSLYVDYIQMLIQLGYADESQHKLDTMFLTFALGNLLKLFSF